MDNIDIVNKALTGEMVIPQFEDFCANIEEIFESCEENRGGKVCSYIHSCVHLLVEYFK